MRLNITSRRRSINKKRLRKERKERRPAEPEIRTIQVLVLSAFSAVNFPHAAWIMRRTRRPAALDFALIGF